MPNGVGLGSRIRNWMENIIPEWADRLQTWYGIATGRFMGDVVVDVLTEQRPEIEALRENIESGQVDISQIGEVIRAAQARGKPADMPIIYGYYMALILTYAIGVSGPAMRLAQYKADEALGSNRLDPATGIQAERMGAISQDAVNRQLREQGFDDENITAIWNAAIRLLGDREIIALWLRGELAGGSVEEKLAELGYQPDDVENLKTLGQFIPPVQDIIRMAVREAFTPDAIQTFGLHDDFPSQVAEWGEKIGLSREWALNYWAAHWELPSVQMGFSMLHREVIDETELKALMKALDIVPAWRDNLIDISYRVLSRVDVRRMYGLDVLKEDGVLKAYRDLGYNDQDAQSMTEFTIKYVEEADRELAKTEILRAYREGVRSRDWAIGLLTGLGYKPDNAEFYILLEDVKNAEERKKEQLRVWQAQYVEGLWDLTQLRNALGGLGLATAEEERYVNLWSLERDRRAQRPTPSQLGRFYRTGTIPEADYRGQMALHGYVPEMVEWYIADIERIQEIELERLADKEAQQHVEKKRYPSKAELKVWLIRGLITEPQYRARLKDMLFTEADIETYVDQIMLEEVALRNLDTLEELQELSQVLVRPTRAAMRVYVMKGIWPVELMTEEMLFQGFALEQIAAEVALATMPDEGV
jgi:hypothetical protein